MCVPFRLAAKSRGRWNLKIRHVNNITCGEVLPHLVAAILYEPGHFSFASFMVERAFDLLSKISCNFSRENSIGSQWVVCTVGSHMNLETCRCIHRLKRVFCCRIKLEMERLRQRNCFCSRYSLSFFPSRLYSMQTLSCLYVRIYNRKRWLWTIFVFFQASFMPPILMKPPRASRVSGHSSVWENWLSLKFRSVYCGHALQVQKYETESISCCWWNSVDDELLKLL